MVERFSEISLSIDYEDAVAEPRTTLSRISEFCGANVDVKVPLDLGDDHGCSRAYREFIDNALREDRPDLFWLR
jgi:hypothetical protein